jgi:hypothetical protein
MSAQSLSFSLAPQMALAAASATTVPGSSVADRGRRAGLARRNRRPDLG